MTNEEKAKALEGQADRYEKWAQELRRRADALRSVDNPHAPLT